MYMHVHNYAITFGMQGLNRVTFFLMVSHMFQSAYSGTILVPIAILYAMSTKD